MKIRNFRHAKNRGFLGMMKKSQTEIMGLAIVVILIILGMTFFIKFKLNVEPVDYRKPFLYSQIASNTLNTLLKSTSADCNGLSITELLQDCSHGNSIFCGSMSSCEYVEETTDEILNKTLGEWKMEYEFVVYKQKSEPIIELGKPCQGEKKSKHFFIPTSSGTVTVRLEVCG